MTAPRRTWIALSAATRCGLFASPAFGGVQIDVIAKAGDPAPGALGAVFEEFDHQPAVCPCGGVLTFGVLRQGEHGVTNANYNGIWRFEDGEGSLLVRAGDEAPGAKGAIFSYFFPGHSCGEGRSAFRASLQLGVAGVTSSNNDGVWLERNGELLIVAREGFPAPQSGGAVFDAFSNMRVAPSGDIVHLANLRQGIAGVTSSNDRGIWATRDGVPTLVAREGMEAPGVDLGVFREFIGEAEINDAGSVAFLATVVNGSDIRTTVWRWSDGKLALVAKALDPAPGAGGARFRSFSRVALGPTGAVLVTARLEPGDPGVTSTNSGGLWIFGSDGDELVARAGDPAPGTQGAEFGLQLWSTRFNSSGDFTISNSLALGVGDTDATNARGVWARIQGVTRLIARQGDPAPGPGNPTFDWFGGIRFSPRGDIVCYGSVRLGSAVVDNFWAYSTAHQRLVHVARVGDSIDIDPDPLVDDRRTIEFFWEYSSGMSDAGEFAIPLEFTDGALVLLSARLPTTCLGDIDEDGFVGFADLNTIISGFNLMAGDPGFRGIADLDSDGLIGFADLNIVLARFNGSCE